MHTKCFKIASFGFLTLKLSNEQDAQYIPLQLGDQGLGLTKKGLPKKKRGVIQKNKEGIHPLYIFMTLCFSKRNLVSFEEISDVDPDPVGSAFIWVRGSGSGSRGIK